MSQHSDSSLKCLCQGGPGRSSGSLPQTFVFPFPSWTLKSLQQLKLLLIALKPSPRSECWDLDVRACVDQSTTRGIVPQAPSTFYSRQGLSLTWNFTK